MERAFDAIGNVVNDGGGGYTYDLRNKLLEQSAAAAGSPPEVRYRYDARGYRVLATSQLAGNGSVEWVLDSGGEQLVERMFDQFGQQVGQVAFVSLGFRMLARIEGAEMEQVVSNPVGLPLMVADGTGAALWQKRADAFGEPVELLAGSEAADPLRRYPGQWAAAQSVTPVSSNLYYNGHRWYDAKHGRYTQADPAFPGGGGRPYSYVRNSPFRWVDPSGLAEFDPGPGAPPRPNARDCCEKDVAFDYECQKAHLEQLTKGVYPQPCKGGKGVLGYIDSGVGEVESGVWQAVQIGLFEDVLVITEGLDPCVEWCVRVHEYYHYQDKRLFRGDIMADDEAYRRYSVFVELPAYKLSVKCIKSFLDEGSE